MRARRKIMNLSHRGLIIVFILFTLILSACEWKPPRRKTKHINSDQSMTSTTSLVSQRKVVSQDKANTSVNTSVNTSTESKKIVLSHSNTDLSPSPNSSPTTTIDLDQHDPSSSIIHQQSASDGSELAKPDLGYIKANNHTLEIPVLSNLSDTLPLPNSNDLDYLFTVDPEGEHEIHVKQIQMTNLVVRRRPRRHDRTFALDEKYVRVFLTIRNFQGKQKVKILWKYQGEIQQIKYLTVGNSPRWRTWSTLDITNHKLKLGLWTIEVISRRKRILAKTYFDLER
jgi:hypothetical protein